VVSVPLEGALVAGVRAVFHFVSVTSVGVAAAAAAPVASVVVVVGGPSVTTVSLLKSFKLQLRSWDWGKPNKRLNQVRDHVRGKHDFDLVRFSRKNETYVLNFVLVLVSEALAHGDSGHRQNAESDENLQIKYSLIDLEADEQRSWSYCFGVHGVSVVLISRIGGFYIGPGHFPCCVRYGDSSRLTFRIIAPHFLCVKLSSKQGNYQREWIRSNHRPMIRSALFVVARALCK
jgi:hypothetical protein